MRSINGTIHKNKRRKVLKQAKGFRGSSHTLYRTAKTAILKAGQHAYNSRRQKKREMRALWIVRINAAARQHGLSYSRFISLLKKNNVDLDRRSLAELAFSEPLIFQKLLESCKSSESVVAKEFASA